MQLGMGGSPMPVTSTENLTFLDVEIPLVSSAGARKVAEQAEKGKEHDDREAGAEGGVYEVILPPAPEGQLLPTFKKLAEDACESFSSYAVRRCRTSGTTSGGVADLSAYLSQPSWC